MWRRWAQFGSACGETERRQRGKGMTPVTTAAPLLGTQRHSRVYARKTARPSISSTIWRNRRRMLLLGAPRRRRVRRLGLVKVVL